MVKAEGMKKAEIGQKTVILGFDGFMKAEWAKYMDDGGMKVKVKVEAEGTAGREELEMAMRAMEGKKEWVEGRELAEEEKGLIGEEEWEGDVESVSADSAESEREYEVVEILDEDEVEIGEERKALRESKRERKKRKKEEENEAIRRFIEETRKRRRNSQR